MTHSPPQTLQEQLENLKAAAEMSAQAAEGAASIAEKSANQGQQDVLVLRRIFQQ